MSDKNSSQVKDLNSYSTLKEIKKIPFGIFDADEILRSLGGEPDRVAAIVGAELISTITGNIICKKMNVDIDLLRLSSSARLDLISGSLTKDAFAEIKLIFLIRNAFAHSPVNLKFDTLAVARECEKITATKSEDLSRLFPNFQLETADVKYNREGVEVSGQLLITDRLGTIGLDFHFPNDDTHKSRFISAVGIISAGLLATELEI